MQGCQSTSGEAERVDKKESVADPHAQLLPRAADCLRDLRFVCTVNWVVASLRRPFSLGCCIIAASSSTSEAAYIAAMFLNSEVVPLWVWEPRSTQKQDSNYVLRQILHAVAATYTSRKSVVIIAPASVLEDTEQLVLLQHFVVHGGLAGSVRPEALLDAYKDCAEELGQVLMALGLARYVDQVLHPC
jgi:hypothetical protein